MTKAKKEYYDEKIFFTDWTHPFPFAADNYIKELEQQNKEMLDCIKNSTLVAQENGFLDSWADEIIEKYEELKDD